MKLRNRFLVPVIGVTVVVAVMAYVIIDHAFRQQAELTLYEDVSAKIGEIGAIQREIEVYCLSHASTFSQDQRVQEAFSIALSGDITDENDPKAKEARAVLRRAFKPLAQGFTTHMGETRYSLHFHLPTGRSLLRAWSATQDTSDDLSSFRQTVLDINQGRHESITGVEAGRGGFAIRGLVPVVGPGGEHLGSVEMLSNYVPLVLTAKTNDEQNFGVYMNAGLLEITTSLADPEMYPLIDERYVLVAHTDRDLVMQYIDGDMLDMGVMERTMFRRNQYHITLFPIEDYTGENIGVIAYALDGSEARARLTMTRLGVIIGALVFMCVLGLTAIFVVRPIIKPLKKGVAFAQAIASGDLTEQVDVISQDELGDLTKALNEMSAGLNSMVGEVTNNSSTMASMSEELSSNAGEMASSAVEMNTQSASAAAAVEQLSSNLANIASGTDEMSTSVTTAATAIEEMSSSLAEVARSCAECARISSDADGKARTAGESITALNASAEEIGKVIETIGDIADQTNLLALNAAIEAAGAGEAGKGFAVVAGEVKELAKQTVGATEEIERLIGEMQSKTSDSVEITGTISEIIGRLDVIVQTIASAVEEQSTTTNEIAQSVGGASQAATDISRNIQEASTGSTEVSRNIQGLRTASDVVKSGADQTNAGSGELAEMAARLRELIGQFKTGDSA